MFFNQQCVVQHIVDVVQHIRGFRLLEFHKYCFRTTFSSWPGIEIWGFTISIAIRFYIKRWSGTFNFPRIVI